MYKVVFLLVCLMVLPALGEPENLKCSACQIAIGKLEGAVKADPAKIQQLVEKACSTLHVPDDKCQFVIQALQAAESASPQEVCELVKLCTSDGFDVPQEDKLEPENLKCTACQVAVGKLKGAIKADPTKIQQFVEKACSNLHIPDDKCQLVIQTLQAAESATPEEVCELVKLCTSEYDETQRAKKEETGQVAGRHGWRKHGSWFGGWNEESRKAWEEERKAEAEAMRQAAATEAEAEAEADHRHPQEVPEDEGEDEEDEGDYLGYEELPTDETALLPIPAEGPSPIEEELEKPLPYPLPEASPVPSPASPSPVAEPRYPSTKHHKRNHTLAKVLIIVGSSVGGGLVILAILTTLIICVFRACRSKCCKRSKAEDTPTPGGPEEETPGGPEKVEQHPTNPNYVSIPVYYFTKDAPVPPQP